jgi:SAM-dependent methyltransferase
MHPVILEEFNKICSDFVFTGTVLEIGATPSKMTLLAMESLEGASKKVGVNLNPASKFRDIEILQENSNNLSFEDDSFDMVISNATLEHDKYFWKTLGEIRRVLKPGGRVILGVPGYRFYKMEKIKFRMRRSKWLRKLYLHPKLNMFFFSTITFEVHDFPGDFFRFSEQAVLEVLLDGFNEKTVASKMLPPRLIGSGILP